VDVKGYTAWSLLDDEENFYNITQYNGLYSVDFKNETRTRTPKASAMLYRFVLAATVYCLYFY
jgi:beta-glucosidase/6-phospho-beta-glucosidase/beta-galactosidase